MSYVFKIESANTFICESNGIPLKYSFQWLAMVGVDEYISGIIGGSQTGQMIARKVIRTHPLKV